eukprot:2918785-Rhodomonas_salina.1
MPPPHLSLPWPHHREQHRPPSLPAAAGRRRSGLFWWACGRSSRCVRASRSLRCGQVPLREQPRYRCSSAGLRAYAARKYRGSTSLRCVMGSDLAESGAGRGAAVWCRGTPGSGAALVSTEHGIART